MEDSLQRPLWTAMQGASPGRADAGSERRWCAPGRHPTATSAKLVGCLVPHRLIPYNVSDDDVMIRFTWKYIQWAPTGFHGRGGGVVQPFVCCGGAVPCGLVQCCADAARHAGRQRRHVRDRSQRVVRM